MQGKLYEAHKMKGKVRLRLHNEEFIVMLLSLRQSPPVELLEKLQLQNK